MKKIATILSAAAMSGMLLSTPAFSDDRELIEMPADVQVKFLSQMRGLVEALDEMLAALEEGNFDHVSRIADFQLGFKHGKWQKMLASGMSEDEVHAKINEMREKLATEKTDYSKKSKQSPGRYMPQNARTLGREMHLSASKISLIAQNAGETPGLDKYKEVLAGMQGITSSCVACHTSYKIR
ncbi:MAG: hypothetical protein L3J32_05005 [Rhizobiaceae bacterium]|nr:hypothetical protein [Rhizobiaceae bacterium]